MRIGLEIDGVIADIFASAVNTFGCPTLDSAYSLDEMFLDVPDELLEDWRARDTVYLHMPVIAGAVEGMAALSEHNDLYLVTYRPIYLANVTLRWLRKNGFKVDPPLHSTDKFIEMSTLGLDAFIDSDPSVINGISGTDGYLFSQPFNQSRMAHQRVLDWTDLTMRLK